MRQSDKRIVLNDTHVQLRGPGRTGAFLHTRGRLHVMVAPFALIVTLSSLPSYQTFDYTMSQDPPDPSTSISSTNFQTVYAAALKGYKEQTKKDIDSHPLAAELKSCDSPNAVLTVLQSQVQKFDPSETANGRWAKLLDPTVTVLYTCSGFISNVTGPVNCETFSA